MSENTPGTKKVKKCSYDLNTHQNTIKSLRRLYESEPLLEKLSSLLLHVDIIDIRSFLNIQVKETEKKLSMLESLQANKKKIWLNRLNSFNRDFLNTPSFKILAGFNFERKGFITLLDRVMQGKIKEIVVAHNDRLTRIGFTFILFICEHFHTKLTVLSHQEHRSAKREFTDEFISVITYFTAKFYGMRKYHVL